MGLLPEGGEPTLTCGARLMRVVASSAPFKEPEVGEFRRMEKRSKRELTGSVLVPDSSSVPVRLKRSLVKGASGSELLLNRERCAALLSSL